MILISATLPSNASLSEFYNEVMTFNDSVMELVCCKLDGTPVTISCGRGFSCAAACYSKEAVLCPSHNCDECDNVDEDKEEGSENVEKTGRRLSWSTQFSGAMNHCTRRGCQVGRRSKYCCFHPVCRRQKKRQCSWLQYFLGRLSISKSFQTIAGTSCPRPGKVVDGDWSCEKQEIPLLDTHDLDGEKETYPGDV